MTITVNDSVNMFYNTLYKVGFTIGAGVLAFVISRVARAAMPEPEQFQTRSTITFVATVLVGLYCASNVAVTPFQGSAVIHSVVLTVFSPFLLPGAILGFLGPYALIIPIISGAAIVSQNLQR